MRTFYDAITPANIPVDAAGVCGYIDGKYAWTAADWARFPNAVKARIAVFSSTSDGHILDVEWGCSTPQDAPGWVAKRRRAGIDPTVYTSYGNLGQNWGLVINEFHRQGVAEPHWWIAAYPGNGSNLYPGAVAHQYANPGPVDISVAADYWPGVDNPPTQQEDDMLTPEAQTWIEGRLDAHDAFVLANLKATIGRDVTALRAQADPVALATAGTVVTQAELEAALRVVLGSVDGTP